MCNDNQCRTLEVVQYSQRNTDIKNKYEGNRKKGTKGGKMRRLPSTFFPGPLDVICARGAAVYCHPGNRRYRTIIEMNLQQYSEARSKMEKSRIVSTVVASIRRASPEGGFIKEESGSWYEVGDHLAREKVGQSFRDSLHTMYRSSSKAKNSRSKAQKATLTKQNQSDVSTMPTNTKKSSVVVQQHGVPEVGLVTSLETAPAPNHTISSNQLEHCNFVEELFREFKYEDSEDSDCVNELVHAFRYEDNPTTITSFGFNGNNDMRLLQSKTEQEGSFCWKRESENYPASGVLSSPLPEFEQFLGQLVEDEISLSKMVSEDETDDKFVSNFRESQR